MGGLSLFPPHYYPEFKTPSKQYENGLITYFGEITGFLSTITLHMSYVYKYAYIHISSYLDDVSDILVLCCNTDGILQIFQNSSNMYFDYI